jgi:RNA polymerase sigma factor (sigma-70 family)
MPQLLLHTQSDERLALLASAGRPAAFAVLVERHRRSLYGAVLRIVSIGEAEDVVQVTLLQAWAALQRGGEVRHVRGWLHQIARHVALRHRAQPMLVGDIDEQAQQALAVTPDPDARLLLRETLAALADLPDKQREALLRCAVHGESQASVAGDLQTTEPGVRQLMYRARIALRSAATALLPLPVAEWATARAVGAVGGAAAGGGIKVAVTVVALAGSSAVATVTEHQLAPPARAAAAAAAAPAHGHRVAPTAVARAAVVSRAPAPAPNGRTPSDRASGTPRGTGAADRIPVARRSTRHDQDHDADPGQRSADSRAEAGAPVTTSARSTDPQPAPSDIGAPSAQAPTAFAARAGGTPGDPPAPQ